MILYVTDSPLFKRGDRYYALGLALIVERYKKQFGKFAIVTRLKEPVEGQPYVDVTDCFTEVIDGGSLTNGLMKSSALCHKIEQAMSRCDLMVIRMPSYFGLLAEKVARKQGKPVFVELCACAWDGHWNHSLKGKVLAPYIFEQTRSMTAKADYVHYVTEEFLQRRYPSKAPQVAASDVTLDPITEATLSGRRQRVKDLDKKRPVLMTSAAIDVRYKGQEYVIEALALLKKQGIHAVYKLAGGGDKTFLEEVAHKHGVLDQVKFLGRLSRQDVFNELDSTDIYIQPSLQEGLPRAMAEALSRGCPSIGARTGGIPELVPEECVVARKSPQQIAQAIIAMTNKGLERYSEKAFARAADFEAGKLKDKLDKFYDRIKQDIGHKA